MEPLREQWLRSGRLPQYPVHGAPDAWLVTGGRGSGKTRLGAEYVNALVRGLPPFSSGRIEYGHIALIGETFADAREVMVEGPSGILATARDYRPRYEASRRRVVWPRGQTAYVFSSEDPESLRGPQFDAAWGDELGKWKNAEATFDMLQFGLRLGVRPMQLFTTTPRATPLMKRLMADAAFSLTPLRTKDNAGNLAPAFMTTLTRRYGGTRLARQELDGELIEDRPDALWSRAAIERAAGAAPAELRRIVVAVDPPGSAKATSDACGIVAAGLGAEGAVWVLADASLRAARPDRWAAAVVALFHRLEADTIVAEVNQGGDMVAAVIRAVDPDVPVKAVRARRGKWLRAEPIAALYEQGRVRHAGRFPELEDEMCDFGPDGLSAGRSPDRLDALVWAVGELVGGRDGTPRIRSIGR
ncbi:MAG: DNA-packaging protein [Rhizobiaceae bacterium]